jgi:hypothetical protein
VSRTLFIVTIALSILLAGCGGSPADNVRSAVSHMQDVIQTYNASGQASLTDTSAACKKAYDDLGDSSALVSQKLTGKQAQELKLLRRAYRSARAGFLNCEQAAAALDFPRMAAAQQQLAAANAAIARARRLER